MSDQDPIRWTDAPDGAPPGAGALVRSIEAPPALPPDLSRIVIPRARRPAWRRWIGPSLAAAVIAGGILLWRFAPIEREPSVVIAALDEPIQVDATDPSHAAVASDEVRDDRAAGLAPPAIDREDATDIGGPDHEPPRGQDAPLVAPRPLDRARVDTAPARPEAQPAQARSRGEGWLTAASVPWSRLFVDGRDTGLITPVVRLPLESGRHAIELRTETGASLAFSVDIRAGETTRVARRFEDSLPQVDPGVAFLTINTMPWARVFVDGIDTGRNTPVRDLPVSPGHHTIGLRTADGAMHTVRVTVAAGETTRIVRQL